MSPRPCCPAPFTTLRASLDAPILSQSRRAIQHDLLVCKPATRRGHGNLAAGSVKSGARRRRHPAPPRLALPRADSELAPRPRQHLLTMRLKIPCQRKQEILVERSPRSLWSPARVIFRIQKSPPPRGVASAARDVRASTSFTRWRDRGAGPRTGHGLHEFAQQILRATGGAEWKVEPRLEHPLAAVMRKIDLFVPLLTGDPTTKAVDIVGHIVGARAANRHSVTADQGPDQPFARAASH
jgi:hypothetical protein